MIVGKISPGSGLGDMLFSYIITRVIALDKGYEFGFVGKEFFKGASFMNLDWGADTSHINYHIDGNGDPHGTGALHIIKHTNDKLNPHFVFNKPYYDPEVNFIEDGTVIDGYGAQDIRYFEHRLKEIKEWLKVEPLEVENVVLNLRGGEYRQVPELFLPQNYWDRAICDYFIDDIYEVHTDDLVLADTWFKAKAYRDISLNWRSLRYAKNAIISNSAFAIIPRILAHMDNPASITIAPKGWANYNAKNGVWNRPQNYYSKFTYI